MRRLVAEREGHRRRAEAVEKECRNLQQRLGHDNTFKAPASPDEELYVRNLERALGKAAALVGGPSTFAFPKHTRDLLCAFLPNGIQLCLNVDAFAEHLSNLPEWAADGGPGASGFVFYDWSKAISDTKSGA